MQSFNYLDCLEKSTMQAIATGVMSRVIMRDTPHVLIPLLNRTVPIWLFGGLVGFAASHINDGIHSLVKSEVHIREKALDEASMVIAALVGGITYWGILALLDTAYVEQFGYYNSFGTGAAGEIIGSFAFNLLRG